MNVKTERSENERAANAPDALPQDYWSVVRRRFRRRRFGVAGLAVVGALAVVAVLAPLVASSAPLAIRLSAPVHDLFGERVLVPSGWSFPLFASLTRIDLVLLAALGAVAIVLLPPLFSPRRAQRVRRVARRLACGVFVASLVLTFVVYESKRTLLAQIDFHEVEASLSDGDFSFWPPVRFGPEYLDRRVDNWQRPLWLGLSEFEIGRAERIAGENWRDRYAAHALGTDDSCRDILSLLVHGTRVSLSVGLVAVGIYVLIGTILGALAGYFGGFVDVVVLRSIEIVSCFPSLVLVLAVVAVLPPSLFIVMAVIGLVGWPTVARLVRGEFLRLREQDFVTAAAALGVRETRIIFRHVLPNAMAPVLVTATFGVAGAILLESALSFLGIGVPVDLPTWGSVLRVGREMPQTAWWVSLFPGLAILVTILSYNLFAEALRDALDPRLKGDVT